MLKKKVVQQYPRDSWYVPKNNANMCFYAFVNPKSVEIDNSDRVGKVIEQSL